MACASFRRLVLIAAAWAAITACGGDDLTSDTPMDAGADRTAGDAAQSDAAQASDAPARDATSFEMDAQTLDAMQEGAVAPPDASTDASPDVIVDAALDVMVDAPPDVIVDAPSDVSADVTVDAPPDSSPDSSADAESDASTMDAGMDGALCPAPDAAPLQYFATDCNAWLSCNGYDTLAPNFWDPCRPMRCVPNVAGQCVPLSNGYAAPDGTPCDDNDPRSIAGPATCTSDSDCLHGGAAVCAGGEHDGRACVTDDDCTPNQAGPCRPTCAGGANAGSTCNLDTDCPSSACTTATKKCSAGTNRGGTCSTNSDCNNYLGDYFGEGISGCNPYCIGGSAPTGRVTPCFDDSECSALYGAASACCPGASLTCTSGGGVMKCSGGLLDGQDCFSATDCIAAKCVKWSCDTTPGHQYCVGQNGIPSCPNGQADCDVTPYTKYCALDQDYLEDPWVSGTLADPSCGTNGSVCPNTCHGGTMPFGPPVTYTCNTATHQCLGASVPCLGGARGAGTVCNNVCRAGRCASDFVACQ
jgi:hypothetical protein